MKLNTNLNCEEYTMFVKKHPLVHYMKTPQWASMQNKNTIIHYLGFEDNNELVGAALCIEKKFLGKSYLYIPWGPCLDYTNMQQFTEIFELLKSFALSRNVFMLRTDPNIIRVSRDIDGQITDGINNENITQALIQIGFQHKGYGYAYNGSWVNRYTLIVDLSNDIDDIFKHFAKPRQTAIKRHSIIGVRTRLGTQNDLPALCEFERELAQLQGFKPHSSAFFNQYIQIFSEYARFYVTEIDLDQMINGLDDEIHSKKYAKDKEALQSKQKEYQEAIELKKQYGNIVTIAAGLFLYYGNVSWDLYTYNKKSFGFVKPVDNLHYFAMTDMKTLGVTTYDMCGFSGVTTPEDPYYGLYSYKKSFGSQFTEYIGEFDAILNEKTYTSFKKQYRLISKIKRKMYSLRYKKK